MHMYRKHFMLAYEERWKPMTRGTEWLKSIVSLLKNKEESLFLNIPPFDDLSIEEEKEIYQACVMNDLLMSSFYLKPGVQTLIILDNRFNEETGLLEEVIYSKDYSIERMT